MALDAVRRTLADLPAGERQRAVRAVVGDHAPLVFARDRTLPVHPVLEPLLGSLTRGHTVHCTGTAAMSCALALMAAPTQAGSWAAVVGVPDFGIAAASELGVVLSRTIFVNHPLDGDPANALGALVDGVDLVVLARRVVSSLSPSLARRLQTRVQSRGAILVVVGHPGALAVDRQLMATAHDWEGLGTGDGHLQRRRVTLELDGRRRGATTRRDVWLPAASGALESVSDVVSLRRTG